MYWNIYTHPFFAPVCFADVQMGVLYSGCVRRTFQAFCIRKGSTDNRLCGFISDCVVPKPVCHVKSQKKS